MRDTSRKLADQLPPGDHSLSNADLRRIYGLRRVTGKARATIANELRRSGLDVVSPHGDALVVRKTSQRSPARKPSGVRPWWRRGWFAGLTALLLLFVLAAALSGGSSTNPTGAEAETPSSETPQATTATTTTATTTTDAEASSGPSRAEVLAMVDDDHYAAAAPAAAAAALGDNDEHYVLRRIANRIARRAIAAVGLGHRKRARYLLASAARYPSTSRVAEARSTYRTAVLRAQERARERSRARAQARERARVAAEARRAARRAAAAAEQAAASAPDVSTPSMSGPSTVNWCGKRDGDGDGIYCEGE